jgi:hypothetical protein
MPHGLESSDDESEEDQMPQLVPEVNKVAFLLLLLIKNIHNTKNY